MKRSLERWTNGGRQLSYTSPSSELDRSEKCSNILIVPILCSHLNMNSQ